MLWGRESWVGLWAGCRAGGAEGAVLCRAMRCCVVVCGCVGVCVGRGGIARVQFLAILAGHTPRTHRQGPYEGPTWGCPTASRSYSQTVCR